MHRYTVLETTDDGRLLALRDGANRYHVARISASVPSLGAELEGLAPALGYAILIDEHAAVAHRMHFEYVDISHAETLAIIHPVSLDSPRLTNRAWKTAAFGRLMQAALADERQGH